MSTFAISRPRNVTIAVGLLCAVLVYGLISGAVHAAYATLAPPVSRGLVFAIGLSGICIDAFFVYKIFKGRNWARIIYLVFFLLGILLAMRGFVALFGRSPAWAALSLIAQVVRAVALVLLFTGSGRAWFKAQAN